LYDLAVRPGAIAASLLATMTVAASAHAEPRAVLIHDFRVPGSGAKPWFDVRRAGPDGRAWVQHSGRAFVLGPGDAVRRLAAPDEEGAQQATDPPREQGPRLSLGEDGTIERDGTRAALPDSLLRALGAKAHRRALAYDVVRERYALLRSRRPLLSRTGYEDGWSIVWFTPERIVDESAIPEGAWRMPRSSDTNAPQFGFAVANGVAWVGVDDAVLRWDDGTWTVFADEASYNDARDRQRRERNDVAQHFAAFTLGNAAVASVLSLPVSLVGRQRFAPTATISFAGSLPALGTAWLMTEAASDSDKLGSALTGFVGTLTVPVVALTTYGTGELAFGGTNEGSFLGALGGAAAGALAWYAASLAFPKRTLKERWWWVLPLGGGIIGTASTAGYLWAGEGLSR
jgi:hypothetical protein